MNTTTKRDNTGFVLIELLMVMSILAILTSIVFPRYFHRIEQARAASCESNRHNIELETISAELVAGSGQPLSVDFEGSFFQRLTAMLPPWTGQAWAAKPKKPKKDKKKKDKSDEVGDDGAILPLIDSGWQCPSGGVYLWLITDPEDFDYPMVGCSIHFAELPEL